MSSKKLISFTNFNGGLNTTESIDEVAINELIAAENIDLQIRGGYSKRLGCAVHAEIKVATVLINKPVSCIIDYPGKPLAVIDKKIYTFDSTQVTNALNSSTISYEFFTNSKLYVLDGTQYWMYDGTTFAAVTVTGGVASNIADIRKCTHITQRGQRMFAYGNPDHPNYLYYSEVGDPTVFLPASIVTAVTDDIDSLMGHGLFNESLILLKKNSGFSWTGWNPSSDVEFKNMDIGRGTVSADSVVISDSYMIFASENGIFSLMTTGGGIIKPSNVSAKIQALYEAFTHDTTMKAIVYKGNYYLAGKIGTTPVVLKGYISMAYSDNVDDVYGLKVFPWTVITGWDVKCWIKLDNKLYFGSGTDATIYEVGTGLSDAGEIISMKASHYLKFEDPVVLKKLKRLFIIAKQYETTASSITVKVEAGYLSFDYNVEIEVGMDDSGSFDVTDWDEVLWDWVDTAIKEIRLRGKLSRIKVTISNDAVDESVFIYSLAALYKVKKPKGVKTGVSYIETV